MFGHRIFERIRPTMLILELLLLKSVLIRAELQTVCKRQGKTQLPEFIKDGALKIGGIFTFYTGYTGVIPKFNQLPPQPKCKDTVKNGVLIFQSKVILTQIEYFQHLVE